MKYIHTVLVSQNVALVMLVVVVVLIDTQLIHIEHMRSVIKGFFFSEIAIILVIWKPCNREIPI